MPPQPTTSHFYSLFHHGIIITIIIPPKNPFLPPPPTLLHPSPPILHETKPKPNPKPKPNARLPSLPLLLLLPPPYPPPRNRPDLPPLLPLDTKLLCLSRLIRFIAYGSTTVILALYLSSLGISDERIGLFMTLTLFGDVGISLVLTVVADRVGRRRVLGLGALCMVGSGVVFALVSEGDGRIAEGEGNGVGYVYWGLVAASVLGVISPRWVFHHFFPLLLLREIQNAGPIELIN